MKRILIVDDDVDIANIATEALRGSGETVVHNGANALAVTMTDPLHLLITRFDEFIDADEEMIERRLRKEFEVRVLREVATGRMGRC